MQNGEEGERPVCSPGTRCSNEGMKVNLFVGNNKAQGVARRHRLCIPMGAGSEGRRLRERG